MTVTPQRRSDREDGAGRGGVLGAPRFEHDAVIYGSQSELAAAVAPFVRHAVRDRDAVAVISTGPKLAAIEAALGDVASTVSFTDSGDFYATPARTIATANELREELLASGASRVRLLGEVPFDGGFEERLDWMRYEAIINRVFAAVPQWCVCFYDLRALPAWLIEGAYRTHPHLLSSAGREPNPRYEDPDALTRELVPPSPSVDDEPALDMSVSIAELGTARRAVAEMARGACASDERAMELAIGLNEVLTNAIEHGSERASVRCWQGVHQIVCEVVDEGPGFDDPFAGYSPPGPSQQGGRGLWLARQTFDRVEFESRQDAGLRACLAAEV